MNPHDAASSDEAVQVFTTVGTVEDAQRLASHVLTQRLAACIQILGPLTSHYWWQGQQQRSDEWLCLIKTTRGAYPELEAAVQKIHPYETPEILAMPVATGAPSYLQWLRSEIRSTGTPPHGLRSQP